MIKQKNCWLNNKCSLYQTNMLSWNFLVLTHWNVSAGRHDMSPTLTHYPDSKTTSLCSLSLLLYILSREATNTNFIFFGLNPQSTEHYSLHHRCGLIFWEKYLDNHLIDFYVPQWRPSWIKILTKIENCYTTIQRIIYLQLGFKQFIGFRE